MGQLLVTINVHIISDLPSNQFCNTHFFPIKLTPKSRKLDVIDFSTVCKETVFCLTMLSDNKSEDMTLMRHQFGKFYSEVQTEKQKQ